MGQNPAPNATMIQDTQPESDFSLGEVRVSMTPQERFEEYLGSRVPPKRMTSQRRTLLEHVFERHSHFDADELIDRLNSKSRGADRVSRATVYRALEELVEAGLLRKMSLGERSVYEHDYGYPQHDHLHCTECDALIEFRSQELLELREAVARESGFRVTGHRLTVTGVCKECSDKRRRRVSALDRI